MYTYGKDKNYTRLGIVQKQQEKKLTKQQKESEYIKLANAPS